MDIHIDIKDSRIGFKELEDGEDNVVYVAEPRGLRLLGMMHAARPVEGDLSLPSSEGRSSVDRSARVGLAVLEHAIENWAVCFPSETNVEPPQLWHELLHRAN